jgi:STE24 endopeptidase
MPPLALLVIVATVFWTVVSFYLSLRQSAHVRARRDDVPVDFAQSITLEDHRKAADYTLARERLARFETLFDALVTIVWVLGGLTVLYGVVSALIAPSVWRDVAFLIGTGVVGSLLSLPFALLRTFGIEEKFGFNRTSLTMFFVDRLKSAVISLVVAVPLLYALLWVMRHMSGFWWLWAWFGLVALMLIAPSVYVRLIAPRFNTFAPLTDQVLRARIQRVLDAAGYRASGLFTMDASRRSAHGNAYFIGFGRTKRIVLFDTLLERCQPEEVEAVVAHELGHFLYKHTLFGLARGMVTSFCALAAFGWLAAQPWLLPAFGLPMQDQAVALYVCLLLASVLGPIGAVAGNWISRRNEYQADDYARRTVGVDPMISALTGLARDNAATLTPDPLYALVHHSHPSVPQRVQHLRAMAGAAA